MQYLDPSNARMRLPSLYHGPNLMTQHHNYTSVQSSSVITPPAAAPSSSALNNFREHRTEAANSQLKGNVLLRQDSEASTTSQVSTDEVMHDRNSMLGTSNVGEVGLLRDGLYRDAVPRASSNPSLTSSEEELKLLGNASEISSQTSTSYDHASTTMTSSHPTQQPHTFRVNQLVGQHNARVQLKQRQNHLMMYHHVMVCRKKEACRHPLCAKLKRTLEHVFQCDGLNCTNVKKKNCLSTQKLIRHFMACQDPRCLLCGPVKEVISKRGAKIDNGLSKRQVFPASKEPGPKRAKTDQSDGMLCNVSNDLKKEHDAKVVDGKSAKEFMAECVTDKMLECSAIARRTTDAEVKLAKNIYSFVNNGKKTPRVRTATHELLAKEVEERTATPGFAHKSGKEAGIEDMGRVKRRGWIRGLLKWRTA